MAAGVDYGDFMIVKEELLLLQVCTQLSPEDASARLNEEYPEAGTPRGWFFAEDIAQVECEERSDHFHYVFEC
jgi:hypothetical protein